MISFKPKITNFSGTQGPKMLCQQSTGISKLDHSKSFFKSGIDMGTLGQNESVSNSAGSKPGLDKNFCEQSANCRHNYQITTQRILRQREEFKKDIERKMSERSSQNSSHSKIRHKPVPLIDMKKIKPFHQRNQSVQDEMLER